MQEYVSYHFIQTCWFFTPSKGVRDEGVAISYHALSRTTVGHMFHKKVAVNRGVETQSCSNIIAITLFSFSAQEMKHWRLHCDEHCTAACAAIASLPRGGRNSIFRREWAYSLNKQRQALCLRMHGLLWPGYFYAVCESAFFWVKHGASTLSRLLVDLNYGSSAQHLHQALKQSERDMDLRDLRLFFFFNNRCVSASPLWVRHADYIFWVVSSSRNQPIQRASLVWRSPFK